MSIQDIRLSNQQLKKLRKALPVGDVLQLDDNGDVLIQVQAYTNLKSTMEETPIETICGATELDASAEFWVFSH